MRITTISEDLNNHALRRLMTWDNIEIVSPINLPIQGFSLVCNVGDVAEITITYYLDAALRAETLRRVGELSVNTIRSSTITQEGGIGLLHVTLPLAANQLVGCDENPILRNPDFSKRELMRVLKT